MSTDPEVAAVLAALARAEEPYRQAVLRACEAIGYGRVMQIASDAWRQKDPTGALTVGPCAGGRP